MSTLWVSIILFNNNNKNKKQKYYILELHKLSLSSDSKKLLETNSFIMKKLSKPWHQWKSIRQAITWTFVQKCTCKYQREIPWRGALWLCKIVQIASHSIKSEEFLMFFQSCILPQFKKLMEDTILKHKCVRTFNWSKGLRVCSSSCAQSWQCQDTSHKVIRLKITLVFHQHLSIKYYKCSLKATTFHIPSGI